LKGRPSEARPILKNLSLSHELFIKIIPKLSGCVNHNNNFSIH
jgi:hypothetical protein